MYYIGLMSGTSADAIDAVILDVPASGSTYRLVGFHQEQLPGELREAIYRLATPSFDEIERMGKLSTQLGRSFARSALAVLKKSKIAPNEIRAIGSHGQTIRHRPDGSETYSIQIAEPAIIVEETGITTVAHFRSRDMAAGGQGAPLVPAFHREVFRSPTKSRAVVNIGGIANVTFLPRDQQASISGFDIGPGNVLLDQWIGQQLNRPIDHDGEWARSGRADGELLKYLLNDSFFSRRPPKSTGREYFNLGWLGNALTRRPSLAPEDVQATLVQLTVECITASLMSHEPRPDEVYLCGGGAHNLFLVETLAARIAPTLVRGTDVLGLPAQWVEAAAFAWLAHRALEGLPGNLPDVTGARHPTILGAIYPA